MNRLLMSETPTVAKTRNNKSRRVLQVLQVSASDKGLLVSPNLMSGKEEKPEISQKKTVGFQDGPLSKENTPVVPNVRRSKRKNAAAQDQAKKTSKEEKETKASSNKVSKVTKSKKTATKKNKKQVSSDLKQSKMDSFVASCSTSNTDLESKLKNDFGISVDSDAIVQESKSCTETAVSPVKHLSNDTSMENFKDSGIVVSPNMLTLDNPPESYWKILAEERRIALEEALRENEQLCDQVQVLETENSQLKGCLKEAEKLAEVLRQALE